MKSPKDTEGKYRRRSKPNPRDTVISIYLADKKVRERRQKSRTRSRQMKCPPPKKKRERKENDF